MASYDVQFQKGLSLLDFLDTYGTEEQCIEAVCTARWPDGFVCPECGVASRDFCKFDPVGDP